MKANRAQLAKIHIAKKQLGMHEEEYRKNIRTYGVEHANQLDYEDAEDLLKKLENAGFKPTSTPTRSPRVALHGGYDYGYGREKYKELDGRGKPFAKSSKLRKIEALWRQVSRTKTDESLRLFIKNRSGVDDITFLHDRDANIIITALEVMRYNK